jgi:hypothetical protein
MLETVRLLAPDMQPTAASRPRLIGADEQQQPHNHHSFDTANWGVMHASTGTPAVFMHPTPIRRSAPQVEGDLCERLTTLSRMISTG